MVPAVPAASRRPRWAIASAPPPAATSAPPSRSAWVQDMGRLLWDDPLCIYINGIIYKDDPLLLWDNMGKCGIIYIYSTPRIFGIIVVNEMSG